MSESATIYCWYCFVNDRESKPAATYYEGTAFCEDHAKQKVQDELAKTLAKAEKDGENRRRLVEFGRGR